MKTWNFSETLDGDSEVIEKFHRLAQTRIGVDGAARLFDCVMDLENQPDIKTLTGLLSL